MKDTHDVVCFGAGSGLFVSSALMMSATGSALWVIPEVLSGFAAAMAVLGAKSFKDLYADIKVEEKAIVGAIDAQEEVLEAESNQNG